MIKNRQLINDENTLYIEANDSQTMESIIQEARKHFGAYTELCLLSFRSSHIHMRCLTYDLYDAGDYDNYIIIERIK
jgi:hypothetical protein